jgi:hypothetical protein
MATDFKGLDRWKQLQSGSFGSASSLRPNAVSGVVGQQYRRQQEDYNTAARLLRRQARRGDAGSALQMIKLREEANDKGIAPGGIRRKEEFDAGIRGRAGAMEQGATDLEQASLMDRAFAREQGGIGRPAAPPTRTGAALDILEGAMSGDEDKSTTGEYAAINLGVKNPRSILSEDPNKVYRRTLDSALGKATTPEEIAQLKERGSRFGVKPEAFDRRAEWWNRNR